MNNPANAKHMKNAMFLRRVSLCVLLLFSSLPAAWAANDIKADTASMAANTANWLNTDPGSGGTGIVPATTDIGEFDGTVSATSLANMTLGGANLTLAGLQFDASMASPLTIASGNIFTNGTSGINMSAAITNVTINCGYSAPGNVTWNVAPNTTLALNNSVVTFNQAGAQVLTITGGGIVNVPNAVIIPNFTGSGTGISANPEVLITGSTTFNGLGILIQRGGGSFQRPSLISPPATTASQGLVVGTTGGGAQPIVNLGTLSIGGGFGNAAAMGLLNGGTLTVAGQVIAGSSGGASSRWNEFENAGGIFIANDLANGFIVAPNFSGAAQSSLIYFAGGTNIIGKISYGLAGDAQSGIGVMVIKNAVTSSALYVGSGGIICLNIHGYLYTNSLVSGVLGAATNWSSSLNFLLNSTTAAPFTIKTADVNGVPHNITLSGIISGPISAVTPPAGLIVTGGGVLNLSNTNTYNGNTTISNGIVNLGAAETPGVSGPLGEPTTVAGSLLFGGGTLQYSAANQFDYSGRFDNGTLGNQPISIDTAGQNVTFATAIQGAGTSLTKIGNGTLTLTAANTYDTGTTISGGTLNVNNTSGSGTGSGNVTVSGTGVLAGSGTISGSVTVTNGGQTHPGGVTTTIGQNLTYTNGASAVFDLTASAVSSSNGKIVLSGGGSSTLYCGTNITVTINVTGAGLDTQNYTLFNLSGSGAAIAGAFNTLPHFTGTALAHPSYYSVQNIGGNVVLQYQFVNSPTITSTNISPTTVQANQNVTISATVTPGQLPISSVTVNLSPIGGSSTQALINTGGNNWSVTLPVPAAAFPGNYSLAMTASDTDSPVNSSSSSVQLTVTGALGASETWNGGVFGTSPNWSQNGNWISGLAPGFGDNIFFAGSTGPTPVMDQSYSLAGVTFTNGAGSFNITASGGSVLTLTGGATNNSSAQQILNVPVVLNAPTVTVNDANSAGVVLGGVVSGPSSDSLTTSGNVTLNNANTFAGTTATASGTLKLNNAGALQNSTLNYNGGGTLSFGTLTTASIGALSGTQNLPLENTTPAPVALNIGGNNSSNAYSGNLTDTGNGASLTVSGTGTQTLSGVSTYTGSTTNGAGSTLIIGGAGQLGGGNYAGAINNSGTLNYNSTANQILSGVISGAGALNQNGASTLSLNGVNTYSGQTGIGTGSTLAIGGAGQLGSGNYAQNITDNGSFNYNSTANQVLSGIISGSGAINATGTGKLTLSSANPSFTGATTTGTGSQLQLNNASALAGSALYFNAGALTFGNGVTLATIGGLNGTNSSANLALVDSGNPVTLIVANGGNYAGILSDAGLGGVLVVEGTNETLTGVSTFNGSISILGSGDQLVIGGAGQLGGGNYANVLSPQTANTFVWNSSAPQTFSGTFMSAGFEGGGSVQILGTGPVTTTTGNALNGSGTFTIGSGATFIVGGGGQLLGQSYAGAYGEAMSISGIFSYNSSSNTTLSGVISGNGGAINVNGPGTLSLTSGSSTYSNSVTTVTGGILSYSSDRAAGAVPGSATTNIFLNGGDLTGTGALTLNTNRDIGVGAASGSVGATALIDATGTFTIAGNLVSAGNTGIISLVVNSEPGSGGTVALAGANTYTGNTTIAAGTLSIGDPGSFGLGTYAGNITNNGTFDYSSSGSQTLSGVISDGANSTGALTVGAFPPASGNPTGTLTLTGTNTYTGSTTISGGTLTVGGNGLLGSGTYAASIDIEGTLNFNTKNAQTLSGGISGAGALNQNGTNKLTLAGNNTYFGPTTINNGTLALVGDGVSSGVILQSSMITVNFPGILDPTGLALDGSLHIGDPNAGEGAQTLSGNGSVVSNVVVGTYGMLTPGPLTGYGTLTVGNQITVGDVINGGGAIIINIDHPASGAINDSVTTRGITILTNGSALPTLTVNQGTNDLQTGDIFHLFNIAGNSGVSTLTNLSVTLPASSPDSLYTYVWNTNNLAVNGTLILVAGAPAQASAPVAGFTALTSTNIFATQTVVFTNTSSGSFTNSAWSFGDGNVANLSGASVSNNVSDTYNNAGTYMVQLIVTGAGGSSTNTQVNYIVVKPKPMLGKPVLSGGNFEFTGTNGPAGMQYRILASTNVALPLASWTPVLTNTFGSDGSYGYTNAAPTNKANFFLLVSP
jgi:autotransporter-associated beta strand protein